MCILSLLYFVFLKFIHLYCAISNTAATQSRQMCCVKQDEIA